jgi:hypothetical protein
MPRFVDVPDKRCRRRSNPYLRRVRREVARSVSVTFIRLPPLAAFAILPLAVFSALFLAPFVWHGQTGCTVEWTDFVRFGGISYMSYEFSTADATERSNPSLLGPEFARVQFQIPSDCDYKAKDGDAAYLQPGTALYTVRGYRTDFLLATFEGGIVKLYEVDHIPDAKTGADLLDIEGKVAFIEVTAGGEPPAKTGRIDEPAEVESFVTAVLRAPVTTGDPGRRTGEMYRVALHMQDGIVIRAAYWEEAGELSRGVRYPLPQSARDQIATAIGR